MTTGTKAQQIRKARKSAKQPTQTRTKDAEPSGLYQRAAEKHQQERERFVAAVWQRLKPEENEQAWRAYSDLCACVLAGGRLWTPEVVWCLAPIFRLIEDDMKQAAAEASNGLPTLSTLREMVDVIADDEKDYDTGRRLAGYLTPAAQPWPVADQPAAPDSFPALYRQLCATMADILEHRDCPKIIGEQLAVCVDNLGNATDALDGVATYARYLLPPAQTKLKGRKAATK